MYDVREFENRMTNFIYILKTIINIQTLVSPPALLSQITRLNWQENMRESISCANSNAGIHDENSLIFRFRNLLLVHCLSSLWYIIELISSEKHLQNAAFAIFFPLVIPSILSSFDMKTWKFEYVCNIKNLNIVFFWHWLNFIVNKFSKLKRIVWCLSTILFFSMYFVAVVFSLCLHYAYISYIYIKKMLYIGIIVFICIEYVICVQTPKEFLFKLSLWIYWICVVFLLSVRCYLLLSHSSSYFLVIFQYFFPFLFIF